MSFARRARHALLFGLPARLPAMPAYRHAGAVGRLDRLRQAETRRAVEHALELARYSAGWATQAPVTAWSRAYFSMLARETMDVHRLAGLAADKIEHVVSVDGVEHLDAAVQAGRGVIFVMAHYGRLIMPLVWLGLHGRKLGMLTIDVDDPILPPFERRYLRDKVTRVIGHTGGQWVSLADNLRKLYAPLRAGETMVMLFDAWMPDTERPLDMLFLGGTLAVPVGVQRIAERTGARLVYCSTFDDGWRIRARIRPLPADPAEALRAAVGQLEADVTQAPWLWWQWPVLLQMWRPA